MALSKGKKVSMTPHKVALAYAATFLWFCQPHPDTSSYELNRKFTPDMPMSNGSMLIWQNCWLYRFCLASWWILPPLVNLRPVLYCNSRIPTAMSSHARPFLPSTIMWKANFPRHWTMSSTASIFHSSLGNSAGSQEGCRAGHTIGAVFASSCSYSWWWWQQSCLHLLLLFNVLFRRTILRITSTMQMFKILYNCSGKTMQFSGVPKGQEPPRDQSLSSAGAGPEVINAMPFSAR